tara:strand:+ start:492 stop:707 length:216 start_codon:yes stop_codon:yes gene_type:complete
MTYVDKRITLINAWDKGLITYNEFLEVNKINMIKAYTQYGHLFTKTDINMLKINKYKTTCLSDKVKQDIWG